MQTTSQKLFSEDEVLVLVEQLKAKAQEAISNAYDEGYKAGLKEYAPQLEAERFKVSQLEIQNKKLKSQTIAILSYIDPASAIILSSIVFVQLPTIYEFMGVVLIMSGAVFSEIRKKES